MGTMIMTKNYQNLCRAKFAYSGSSSSYFGYAESEQIGQTGVDPFVTASDGTEWLGLRWGTASSSINADYMARANLFNYLRGNSATAYIGTGGSSLTEESYNADEIMGHTAHTFSYFPSEYTNTFTFTNATASPITFDQVHGIMPSVSCLNSRTGTVYQKNILLWIYVLDAPVTLQPAESFSIRIKLG